MQVLSQFSLHALPSRKVRGSPVYILPHHLTNFSNVICWASTMPYLDKTVYLIDRLYEWSVGKGSREKKKCRQFHT